MTRYRPNLTCALASQLEEEAGAIVRLGIDDIDEPHLWRTVEVGCVGDAPDGGFKSPTAVGLGHDGDGSAGLAPVPACGRSRCRLRRRHS